MIARPQTLNLSNWRAPGHGSWSFHHVREVVPSEPIETAEQASPLVSEPVEVIDGLSIDGLDGATW